MGWVALTELLGALSVVTGLALRWAAGVALPRRLAVAIHVVAGLPQLYFGIEALRAGTYASFATYWFLGIGMLLTPLLPARADTGEQRPDALAFAQGIVQALQGVDLRLRGNAAMASRRGRPAHLRALLPREDRGQARALVLACTSLG